MNEALSAIVNLEALLEVLATFNSDTIQLTINDRGELDISPPPSLTITLESVR